MSVSKMNRIAIVGHTTQNLLDRCSNLSLHNSLLQTFAVNGRGLSWPLGPIIPCLSLFRYVWNYWSEFSRPRTDVMKDFEMACEALSQRLGKEEYFFKTRCLFEVKVVESISYTHFSTFLPPFLLPFLYSTLPIILNSFFPTPYQLDCARCYSVRVLAGHPDNAPAKPRAHKDRPAT